MAKQRTVSCPRCGSVIGVPESGVPAEGIPCIWCEGVYREEKPAAREVKAPAKSQPPIPEQPETAIPLQEAPVSPKTPPVPDVPPLPDSSVPSAPNPALHRFAEDDDDDGTPYQLPAEELKHRPCENCQKSIDLDAVICVHCGYDHRARKKAGRTFTPIDREFTWGWGLSQRLIAFFVCQGLNALSAIVLYAAGGSLGTSVTGVAFMIFLQAFVLGSFPTYRIRRNKKGQCDITMTWRVAFLPQPTKTVEWPKNDGVSYGVYNGAGCSEWFVFIVLLFYLIIPGLLWLWFAILRVRHYVALTQNHDFPQIYVYRGLNESLAKEIAQLISDATSLPLVTKLK